VNDTTHVKGLADLQKFLDELPAKMEANVMRGGLRAGMNVIKPVAKAGVHSISGEVSNGLRVGTRRKGKIVMAYLKAGGKHAFIAHMLEFTGAVAHVIRAQKGKALAIGGGLYQSIAHPGFKAKPFMRPALDSQASAAVVATGEYIKKRLVTKHGLDTSAVEISAENES